MRNKLLNIGLLVSFLFCYYGISRGGFEFIFQTDFHIISDLRDENLFSAAPFAFLLLGGQISLLLAVFFNNRLYKVFTAIGLIWLTILTCVIVLISLVGSYWYCLLSTIPFLILAILTIITLVRKQIRTQ